MVHIKTGKLYLLLAVLVYLNVFDILATLVWCRNYGFDQEYNPLMRYLFALNPMIGVSFKILAVALFVMVMRYGSRHNFKLVYMSTLGIVFIYSVLLCWHVLGSVIAGI